MKIDENINLKDQEFLGKIVPKSHPDFYDPKRQGRYLVHIPDLMPGIDDNEGIWCKNHVHNWRITPSGAGEYGQYFPLQAETYVIVKFFENDLNTGYIDRVLSDYKEDRDVEAQDNVQAIPALTDRDEQYVIFKTPKKWNIFYVNEDTENEPNTIYLIYNRDNSPERRTVFRIDESGLHFWTRDNNRVRIATDENRQVDGDHSEYIKGNQKENIDKDKDTWTKGNFTRQVDKNSDSKVKGDSKEQIEGNRDSKVDKSSKKEIGSESDFKVGSDSREQIGGSKDTKVKSDLTIEVKGNVALSAGGTAEIFGASGVNIDGSSVNINSGIAQKQPASPAASPSQPEEPKEETKVKDLGPNETDEYEDGVGNKCDDATDNYNVGSRDNEDMF